MSKYDQQLIDFATPSRIERAVKTHGSLDFCIL